MQRKHRERRSLRRAGGGMVGALLLAGLVFVAIGWSPAAPVRPVPVGNREAVERPGIHNLFRLSPKLYTGSVPEGEAGFRSLRALGVRTLISVDGARPDVATARRFGLLYVHLPIGYDGCPTPRALE